jgi:curved DNA-binding protein CbpA
MSKDYYRILGVLDDSEDVVIRAAYKALEQRYHPDKWTGNKDDANRRMQEINEAYAVLSDSVKRKQYDATRESKGYQDDAEMEAEESFVNSYKDDWKKVIEYFPDLDALAKNLNQISPTLDFSFKSILIEQKKFNNAKEIADTLENKFLEKYFGKNKEIKNFAKTLILNKKKSAAKELNDVAILFGDGIDAKTIINGIKVKFEINQFGNVKKSYDIDSMRMLKKLADNVLAHGYDDDCIELIKFIGGIFRKESFFDENLVLEINLTRKKLKISELKDLAKSIAGQVENSNDSFVNIVL